MKRYTIERISDCLEAMEGVDNPLILRGCLNDFKRSFGKKGKNKLYYDTIARRLYDDLKWQIRR